MEGSAGGFLWGLQCRATGGVPLGVSWVWVLGWLPWSAFIGVGPSEVPVGFPYRVSPGGVSSGSPEGGSL